MNKVFLMGRIGKAPELKTVGESQVLSGSIATDESYKDKTGKMVPVTDWHNFTIWGKPAEIFAKYVGKGSRVVLEGKIKTDSWEANGEKKYKTYILVSSFHFIDTVKPDGTDSSSEQAPVDDRTAKKDEEDDLPF